MARIHVAFLKKTVWAYVMKNCPTILSLGTLCNEEGWNYSWKNGEDPLLWKDSVVIRLHSKQKVPMMYAAASTGNDHSLDHGSQCQPESVSTPNQDPPHSNQDSSASQCSNSSSSSPSSSTSSTEEVDGQPSTTETTSASDERGGASAETRRSVKKKPTLITATSQTTTIQCIQVKQVARAKP